MGCFVIIPAFNEKEKIGPVVRDIFSLYPDFQVIVVDDGSEDNTALVAKEAGAMVLQHIINRGQGAALNTGTTHALKQQAEIIVHFDADGQFSAAEIKEMLEPIKQGEVDVILGSRFLKDNRIPWTKKHLLLPVARLVNLIFTGLQLSDVHNGFRVFSRFAAESIKISQDKMAHNSEIVSQIKKNKLRFKEVPVTVFYDSYGQGLLGGIKIVRDLIWGKIL